ncbi:AI-2E family transporter [Rhodoblastus sp.]|uniref:AI-2E family transporter n=1 Tax=Rhodoblastus sp. TaxID=1962975 RepID=UPI00262BCE6C|nr:AI-2E family transporter [Rhodoblastus sp.]
MNQDRSSAAPLVLSAAVLLFAAAFFARAILAPVTFAIFIVAIIWPLQDAFQKRLPKLLALVLTLGATLAVLAVMGLLIVWAFGLVAQWLVANVARFQALYLRAIETLEAHGVAVRALMATSLNPSSVTGVLRQIGGQGYGLLSFLVIAFAFTVLGLLEVDIGRRNIDRLENPRLRAALLGPAGDVSAKLRKYMAVRSLMSLLTGAVVWVFALVAGIELATAWGVIAFVLNYIPFIGSLVATVFPSLFTLAQFESWRLALLVFVALNGVQFFIGSYLEPRVAGAQLSLSPFMVLFAVFFWSFLWGIAGAFIGVPLLIVALTVCAEHDSTRWLAILMSGGDAKNR